VSPDPGALAAEAGETRSSSGLKALLPRKHPDAISEHDLEESPTFGRFGLSQLVELVEGLPGIAAAVPRHG
jgi:hypothetical protein